MFRAGSDEDEGEGGDDDEEGCSGEAVDGHSFVQTGLIQNA